MQYLPAITAIALILLVVVPLQAYASDVEIIDIPQSKTWILIIAPGCSFEDSDDLRHRLNYNNTGYEAYLPNKLEVSCFNSDVLTIESNALPLLRSVFPNDAFVFAYDGESQIRDYKIYAVTKYSVEYTLAPLGNADIEKGYGLAQLGQHAGIQHERVHLETCSAHLKGSNNYDVATWTRVSDMPWC